MNTPEGDPLLYLVEQVACTGSEVTVAEDGRTGKLHEARFNAVDPSLVVSHRRFLKHRLASGAIKRTAIERATPDGATLLLATDTNAALGSVRTVIEAEREFGQRGVRRSRQRTDLTVSLNQFGALGIGIDGTVPFDEAMRSETESEWHKLGLALHYHVDDRGGVFAIGILPDFDDLFAQALRTMKEESQS